MESIVRTLKVKRTGNPKGVRPIAYRGKLAVQESCRNKVVAVATVAELAVAIVVGQQAEMVAATAVERKFEVAQTLWPLLRIQGKT